jgi:cellobiose transport system substrate-binding protein
MRIGSRRSAGLVAALAAISLLGAGCGGSSNSANDKSGGSGTGGVGKQKVTLTIGLFGTFGFKEAGLYQEYMKLHPNVTIKEDSVEQSADYYKALQTHLAAGSGLDDIQGIEIGFVADLLAHHADDFVDFNKQPDAAQVKSTFYPWKWQMATAKDGRTIGVGTDAGPEAMCFRKDLFQKAGLPTDRATLAQKWSTWDGFIALGKQYEASSTKPANSHFLDSAASIFSAAVYQGGTAYDDSSGNPIPESSDGVRSAWSFASQAAQHKLTAGLQQFSTPWNQAFSNGAFATISCPAWMLGYITSQAGPDASGTWDVASIPGGAANWGGSWLGVPTASKHQAEAVQLAEWLTAPAQQVKMWTSQQHFPSSSTAAQDSAVSSAKSDYFSGAPIGEIFGASAANLKRTPIGPYDTQIQQAFTTALTAVETKNQDPSKAWQDAIANIKQVVGG